MLVEGGYYSPVERVQQADVLCGYCFCIYALALAL